MPPLRAARSERSRTGAGRRRSASWYRWRRCAICSQLVRDAPRGSGRPISGGCGAHERHVAAAARRRPLHLEAEMRSPSPPPRPFGWARPLGGCSTVALGQMPPESRAKTRGSCRQQELRPRTRRGGVEAMHSRRYRSIIGHSRYHHIYCDQIFLPDNEPLFYDPLSGVWWLGSYLLPSHSLHAIVRNALRLTLPFRNHSHLRTANSKALCCHTTPEPSTGYTRRMGGRLSKISNHIHPKNLKILEARLIPIVHIRSVPHGRTIQTTFTIRCTI